MTDPLLLEQIERLTKAVHLISRGDSAGPTGFELLSMSINGNKDESLSSAITDAGSEIASSIIYLASSINELSQRIK